MIENETWESYLKEAMRRWLASLGCVLFVVGVLVVPAVHKLHLEHCDSCNHSESHNPETCAICMVAATAMTVACIHITAILTERIIKVISLPKVFPASILIPESHQARAPPRA